MVNLKLTDPSLSLRQATEADGELLFSIFLSSRENELKMLSFWTEEQRSMFFRQQFTAQHNYYQQTFKAADFWIIEKTNTPIGRLYINGQMRESLSIIDISILPEYRRKGIGEGILKDIQRLATASRLKVKICVENNNLAKLLYERVGFETTEKGEVYTKMEWKTAEN